ncbi:hypothetical protein CBM2599_A10286 [Cupriavidus taiwanensis]|nr:hypothetical protein CBM2599_A10286 [Cupriavidus taiwanensis]SOY80472.1 hypothetical protein CBM2600_A10129 [Cupriavidus taiwanensis]
MWGQGVISRLEQVQLCIAYHPQLRRDLSTLRITERLLPGFWNQLAQASPQKNL